MYCSKCGKEIKDDSVFCPYCGAPVNVTSQQTTQSQTRPNTSAPNRAGYNTPGANSASWITDSFGGTLFLVISILMTCYLAIYLFSNFGMPRVIMAIPRLFICIGCWMIYSSCHQYNLRTIGYSMVKYGLLALIILYLIPAVFAVFSSLFSIFSAMPTTVRIAVIVIAILFFAACIGLNIWVRKGSGTDEKPAVDTEVLFVIFVAAILIASIVIYINFEANIGALLFLICFYISMILPFYNTTRYISHLQNTIREGSEEYMDSWARLSAIDLCWFLGVYVIQFFALVIGLTSSYEALTGVNIFGSIYDIPLIGEGISSLFKIGMGKTISSLLLISLVICVIVLLFSSSRKISSYKIQN